MPSQRRGVCLHSNVYADKYLAVGADNPGLEQALSGPSPLTFRCTDGS